MSELKPCPFCGQKVYAQNTHGQVYIRCGRCRHTATEREWQARPLEDAKDAEIEALEKQNLLLVQSLKVLNAYVATFPHVATGALKREDFQQTDELMEDVRRLLKLHQLEVEGQNG